MRGLLITVLSIIALSRTIGQTQNDKIAIYHAVLDNYLEKTTSKGDCRILLYDSTFNYYRKIKISDEIATNYLNLDPKVYSDFMKLEKIKDSCNDTIGKFELITKDIFNGINVGVVSTDSVQKHFGKCLVAKNDLAFQCWGSAKALFKCDGFCTLSRPYYYNNETVLIFFTVALGPLNGRGDIYVLVKKSKNWKVVYIDTIWVS